MKVVGMEEAGHTIEKGGVLPTATWPSDHLLLSCEVVIGEPEHENGCLCDIHKPPLSLFEMHYARAALREKKKE